MMAQLMFPDIGASFRDGQAFGMQQRQLREQEGRRSGLAALASQAYTAPQEQRASILSQMAGLDPRAAAQQDEQFASSDDRRTKQVVSLARILANAPAEQKDSLYQRMKPALEQVGMTNLPASYDATVDGTVNSVVQAYTPGTETPSSIRELQMLQANPELAALDMKRRTAGFERPQFQVDAQGQGWWLSPGQAPRPVNGSGSPETASSASNLASPISMPSDLGSTFASLAQGFPGTQITSTLRTPERNAQVGGVPNSQHLKGTAADFVVPAPQRASFIQAARSQGFEAIDEGDHVHVELPPNRRSSIAAGPQFPTKGNASTDDKAANWQVIQGNDGSFYRTNKLTGQLEPIGVTGNNAARVQKMEQERLEKVQGIQGSITQTKTALDSIDTLLSSPGLEAAVGVGSVFPTAPGSEAANFEAQLDTFKAQTFVPMVAQLKGMGALSDAEGKKLSDAVGALNIKMSDAAFRASLHGIKSLLENAQAKGYQKITEINKTASNMYKGQAPAAQAAPPASGGWSIQKVE